MLTAAAIKKSLKDGTIVINPIKRSNINANSVDVTLHPEIKVYKPLVLDPRVDNKVEIREIPSEGMVLHPHELYLARTNEWTESHNVVPMITGKSSLARLGISVHATAGFGDIGFRGFWVLEITVVKPTFIYPNMKIGQLYFHKPEGSIDMLYNGKYQDQEEVVPSKTYIKE